MDNIVYTSAATLILGIFFSAATRLNVIYVSNTKCIIQQGEQIHFLLNRLIDLNKKINKLEIEITTLSASNISYTCLSTIEEEELEEDLEEDLEEKLEEDLDEDLKQDLKQDLDEDLEEKLEEVFELIEPRLSPVTISNKKSRWLSFLF
jgi:hypothetical protein